MPGVVLGFWTWEGKVMPLVWGVHFIIEGGGRDRARSKQIKPFFSSQIEHAQVCALNHFKYWSICNFLGDGLIVGSCLPVG